MAEKFYHFALVVNKGISDEDVGVINKSLSIWGFETKFIKEAGSDSSCFFIRLINYEIFLREAKNLRFEKKKISKRSAKKDFLSSFKQKDKYYYFLESRTSLPPIVEEMELYSEFKLSKRDKFFNAKDANNYQEYEDLFEEAEVIRIIYSLLRKVPLWTPQGGDKLDINASEKMGFQSLINHFSKKKVIKDTFPLHGRRPEKTDNATLKKYFGESTAIYFYFLDYLNYFLLAAGVVGILVFLMNKIFHENVLTSPYESIFSAFMIFWLAAFTASWGKKERQLAVEWRSFGQSFELQEALEHPTIDVTEERLDEVTGLKEKYYPWKKQLMRYTENFLILIPILAFTFFILVLSLNLRGYVDPDHEILYYPSIFYYSEEGKIFDKNTNWGQIPTVIHVAVLFTINMIYKEVAIMMTHREYHASLSSLENSVLVKRFIFETFNTFTDLSYLAFVKFDIKALKFELISIFMFDEIRRVLSETAIPYIMKVIEKRKTRMSKNEELISESKYIKDKLVELTLPKYEAFDDYLEIILNLGYITLFASSFSLAPAIMFVFHLVERYSDRYKLIRAYQRPVPFKSKGIGSWHVVMNTILIFSVFTNITLFAFSSEKMMEFFPWLFQFGEQPHPHSHDEADNHTLFAMATMKQGMGRYVILIIFIIEHVLFLLIWIVKKLITRRKDWVDIYMNRKEYKFRIKMNMGKRKGDEKETVTHK